METALQQKSTRRERWAWYLYDFGNSAYAAVVLLAVYSAYFQGAVVGGVEGWPEGRGSMLWGIAVGIAMLTVALTAPVLGAIADFSGAKKRILFFYTAMCVVFCALLFFVQRGDWFIGMLFFILAEIGYRSAQVFYNALLPEIADQDEMPKISGNGWAIGSIGGIVCLLIVLIPIVLTKSDPLVVRLSLVFTAVFFAVFALFIFLWVKERAERRRLPEGETYLSLALKRLGHTFREVRSFKEFVKFMVAFLIYNDGILMVLDFGAILGAVLFGMEQQELIIFMIIVQITSVVGAYLFGLIAGDFGGKRSLVLSLLLMLIPVVWLYFTNSKLAFYFIGGWAGFALTGVQSVSRTLVGMFSPPGKSAEFYGFFAVTGRTSSFIGPTIFGLLAAWATKQFELQGQIAELAEQSGHRIALFSILAFLLVGLMILLSVNEKKGRAAAQAAPEAAVPEGS
ncbi:MAG: MFS transporter [Anaerolineae bacterium]|nr:MFS transporter [Anaerolineae bacterium]